MNSYGKKMLKSISKRNKMSESKSNKDKVSPERIKEVAHNLARELLKPENSQVTKIMALNQVTIKMGLKGMEVSQLIKETNLHLLTLKERHASSQ